MNNYKKPSEEAVQAALLKLPTFQLRRVFYEGLKNPRWVRPLFEAGAFTSPPEPERTGDGYIRDVYWPEISYLVRVAAEAPADVVDVLLSLGGTANAWVRRAVFEIGSKIPAAEGAKLKPLLQAWTTTPEGFGWRTDPSEIVSFAIKLLEGDEVKIGRWLANYLFAPKPGDSDDASWSRPVLALDDHWYRTELPRIVPLLGINALRAVAGWLADFVKFSGHASEEHDFSGMIRPSIKNHDDAHPSPEDALIDAVRDLAIRAMAEDPEETAILLLGSKVQLLRKIAMFATAEAIRERAGGSVDAQALLSVAERLLGDEASDDEYLRVEYAELARAVAKVDPSALNVINKFLAAAHATDMKWMRERLAGTDTPEEEVGAQVARDADRSKQRWLTAIGVDALPPQLQTELSDLDFRYGVIEDALSPAGMVTSWTGPNPHSTQDEMAAMSAIELVAHLASWHDTGTGWGPEPSHEGQGRELAGLLTTNPRALAGVDDLIGKLRPTYVRNILRGWEAALKADLELDWDQVADLIRDTLNHDNASLFQVEGDMMDDDKDYRWAKEAAVSLLEELVKKRSAVAVPEDRVAVFAKLLIADAADDEAWSEYNSHEPGDGSWDPLTVSLNWQWPNRLRALIHLATRTKESPWKRDAMSAIERELARDDKRGAGRAVLGESMGRLLVDSPDWMHKRRDEFFGSELGLSIPQQIALTTAMAMHYYHPDLYDFLSGPMVAAIRLGDGLASGWRSEPGAVARIGEWVIDAVIRGDKTLDDPVAQAFFTTADPEARGAALGSTAWSFFRAETVEGVISERFGDLWEQRIRHVEGHPEDSSELVGFFWLVRGGKYPVGWWLLNLKKALELEPAIATGRYMIGKELAQASAVDPKTAFAVLQLLLAGRNDAGMVSHDLTQNAVPVVLASALRSGDPALESAANAYMNELGAKGHVRLDAQVRAVLEGALAADDVDS